MRRSELSSPVNRTIHRNTDLTILWPPGFSPRQFDGGSLMSTSLKRDSLVSFANEHRSEYETLLRRFVEIPTVSVDPNHLDDIRKGVELTVKTLESLGGKAEVYHADKGNPVIHGVFGNNPKYPTVTVYNHIDVQPASKETEPWDTQPFVFTQKGDTYYGRGTTDDKGPAL